MDFQQSMTFNNLQTALETELKGSTKNEIYSIKARGEVLIEISYLFDTASRNDRFIAERLRNLLLGGEPNTEQNLAEAVADSFDESIIYRDYARVAREEGYDDISSLFSGIANIKLNHNTAFETVAIDMQNNELFCKSEEKLWICLGCGNILSGVCAPSICPICFYPQGYYQLIRY